MFVFGIGAECDHLFVFGTGAECDHILIIRGYYVVEVCL